MRYLRFQIENFKGIKSLEVRLDRLPSAGVYTLVGLNESGKSTILQAMHWLDTYSNVVANDIIPRAERLNFNGTTKVSAELELYESDNEAITNLLALHGLVLLEPISRLTLVRSYAFKNSTVAHHYFRWEFSLSVRKKRKGSKAFALGATDAAAKPIKEYLGSSLLPPIVYYENFLFSIPDRIYLMKPSGKSMTPGEVVYRDAIQDVLSSLDRGLTVEEHLLARHESAASTDRNNIRSVLDAASAKLTDEVIAAWAETVGQPDQPLEVSLGQTLEEDETGVYLQLWVKEGRNTFYIRERSLGFRWFFAFILFTHFRAFRDNSRRNALFLLDEPASNLHPAAQTKLLDAFSKLPNNQLVTYSTHSQHMIKPEWLGGAFVVRNAGLDTSGIDLRFNAGMTDVRAEPYFQYASNHPSESDLYRPILEALEHRPGPLELVPDLVVVEGKNDYYTLRYVVEVAGLSPSCRVYPSAGKDKTSDILALYLGWGRNAIVLLDGDKGGKETAKRLKTRFGIIASSRVFTLEDVDSAWEGYAMEDLFESAERDVVVTSLFPGETYSKSRFNTAIAQLLVDQEKIRLSRTTQTRFRKLLKFIFERMDA